MKKIIASIIGMVMLVGAAASPLPSIVVPNYSAETYSLETPINSVVPVCEANLIAVSKGEIDFLAMYIKHRYENGGITLPEARRVVDACTLYGMGAAKFIQMSNGRRDI